MAKYLDLEARAGMVSTAQMGEQASKKESKDSTKKKEEREND